MQKIWNKMNFIEFEKTWRKQGLICVNEIKAWNPEFNTNNLTRWQKQGFIHKLRKEWYMLQEAMLRPEFSRYVANKIYSPSYISLEYALCFYDIIPESVIDITSVTAKKTCRIYTDIGNFYYYTVKPSLIFGYRPLPTPDKFYFNIALPEKAILDFLYLHPQYQTMGDMRELRFDENYMEEEIDLVRLEAFAKRINSKTLYKRTNTLLKAYDRPVLH